MSSRPCRIQPTLLRIDPHLHDHPRDLRRVSVRTIAGEPPDTAEAVDANFTWLQQSNLPKILFHATPGAIMPPTAVERCKSVLSNLTSVDVGDGIHYLQEDHPHEIGEGIAKWYRQLDG
jgi:haloalkane dehalogenase